MNTYTPTPFPTPLHWLRQWLHSTEIRRPRTARLLCKLIPDSCPFEREIRVGDRLILSIPPLCKLNPLYDQFVELRFKSLTYLAEECGEDITRYCQPRRTMRAE